MKCLFVVYHVKRFPDLFILSRLKRFFFIVCLLQQVKLEVKYNGIDIQSSAKSNHDEPEHIKLIEIERKSGDWTRLLLVCDFLFTFNFLN